MEQANLYINTASSEKEENLFKEICEDLLRNNNLIHNDKLMYLRAALESKYPEDNLVKFIQGELFINIEYVKLIDKDTIIYPSFFMVKTLIGASIIELFEYYQVEFLLCHKELRNNKLIICLDAYNESNGLDKLYSKT